VDDTITQGQFLLTIVLCSVFWFLAGMAYQFAKSKWKFWRETKAAVPIARKNAFASAGRAARALSVGVLVVGALAAAAYARGQG
jgi:hypothetical protein